MFQEQCWAHLRLSAVSLYNIGPIQVFRLVAVLIGTDLTMGPYKNLCNIVLWAQPNMCALYPQWAHMGFPNIYGPYTHGLYQQLRSKLTTWARILGVLLIPWA